MFIVSTYKFYVSNKLLIIDMSSRWLGQKKKGSFRNGTNLSHSRSVLPAAFSCSESGKMHASTVPAGQEARSLHFGVACHVGAPLVIMPLGADAHRCRGSSMVACGGSAGDAQGNCLKNTTDIVNCLHVAATLLILLFIVIIIEAL